MTNWAHLHGWQTHPESVGRWFAERLHENRSGGALWLRYVNGGPGWCWTESSKQPPRGSCLWTLVAELDEREAYSACVEDSWMSVWRIVNAAEAALKAAGC